MDSLRRCDAVRVVYHTLLAAVIGTVVRLILVGFPETRPKVLLKGLFRPLSHRGSDEVMLHPTSPASGVDVSASHDTDCGGCSTKAGKVGKV